MSFLWRFIRINEMNNKFILISLVLLSALNANELIIQENKIIYDKDQPEWHG